jgi:plasmid maintenance system antidote protein VapI
MSLLPIAANVGVTQTRLNEFLQGHANVSIAAQLHVTTAALQKFVDGQASPAMAAALGLGTSSTVAELIEVLGRDGSIGLVLGFILGRNAASE